MALTDNLVAYYRLDEAAGLNALDQVDVRTLGQHAAPGTAAGKLGTARLFASVRQQYFERAEPLLTSGAFSVSLWLYLESLGATQGLWFQGQGAVQQIYFLVDNLNRLFFQADNANELLSAPLTANTWYHLVTTWDGTTARMWQDGIEVDAVVSGAIFTGANVWRLGTTTGAKDFLDGRLDELGVWSRALGPAEITTLYNGGLAYDPTPQAPRHIDAADFAYLARDASTFAWIGADAADFAYQQIDAVNFLES